MRIKWHLSAWAAILLLGAVMPGRSIAAPGEMPAGHGAAPQRVDAQGIGKAKVGKTVTVVGTVERLIEDSGDSVLYVMLDDFKKPLYVRVRKELGRPERNRRYTDTGLVLADPTIPGAYYLFAQSQKPEGMPPPQPPVIVPPQPNHETSTPSSNTRSILYLVGAIAALGAVVAALFVGSRQRKPRTPQAVRRKASLSEVVSDVTGTSSVPKRAPTVAEPNLERGPKAPPRQSTQVQWGTLISADPSGKAYPMFGNRFTVGREEGDLRLPADDTTVSGSHGAFLWENGTASYEDNSTNGTSVNGEHVRRRRVPLSDGAVVQIGRSQYRLTLLAGASPGKPPRAPTQVVDPSLLGGSGSSGPERNA